MKFMSVTSGFEQNEAVKSMRQPLLIRYADGELFYLSESQGFHLAS
jgi:hypothetical protein